MSPCSRIAWNHCTPIDGTNDGVCCNYCGTHLQWGGLDMFICHIVGDEDGLRPCVNATTEVRLLFGRLLDEMTAEGGIPRHLAGTPPKISDEVEDETSPEMQKTLRRSMHPRYFPSSTPFLGSKRVMGPSGDQIIHHAPSPAREDEAEPTPSDPPHPVPHKIIIHDITSSTEDSLSASMSNLSIPGKPPRVPSSSAQKNRSPSGPFHSTFSNSKSSSFLSLSKRSPTDVEYQSDAGNYHDALVVDDKENPATFTRKQEFKNPSGKTPLLLVPKPEPVSPVKKSTKTGKTPVLLVPKTEPVGEVKKSTKRRPSQFTKLPVEINRWLDELEQSEEDKMNKWCTSSDDDKFFEDANDRWDKVKRSPRKKTRDTASRHTSRERELLRFRNRWITASA